VSTRKRLLGFAALAAIVTLVCSTTAARAQDVEPAKHRQFAVKLGTFLPCDGALKTQSDNAWWYVGIDYLPNFRYRLLNSQVGFDVDLRFRDSAGFGFLADSVGVKMLWTLTGPESKARVYAGIGGGIYFLNSAFISASVQPGMKAILGVDLTDRVFLEGAFSWVSGYTDESGAGIHPNGTTVALGVRF
jgi:hypothetical protein